MLFRKDELRLIEDYKIIFDEKALIKLEDAARNKSELLLTIDATHLGMLNGHGVIYRHDTVCNNLMSFIHPTMKPMIERHKTLTSEKFGMIIAADYKVTKFHDQLSKDHELEGLTTDEYMSLCKEVLIPTQRKTSGYNGLGYGQLIGKLNHKDAIRKVLNKEFLNVSIGADPRRLICSVCGQDQVTHICDHYADKGNGIFMLAEELEYEELSFVPRGADPYGRVIQIHDEDIKLVDAQVDVLNLHDFYQSIQQENKTIICIDNVCKIFNQEEAMVKKKKDLKVTSVSFKDELPLDQLKELHINGEKVTEEFITGLTISDELKDDQFAVIQKTEEGIVRRFPVSDVTSVKVGLSLINAAANLTEEELASAKKALERSAKKLEIDIDAIVKLEKAGIKVTDEKTEEGLAEEVKIAAEVLAAEEAKIKEVAGEKTIESLTDELIAILKEVDETKLQDEEQDKPKPVSFVFSALESLGRQLKWAGEDLQMSIDNFLKNIGKETIETSVKDSLTDELLEAKEDIELLTEQNRELNYKVRLSLVDEIITWKKLTGEEAVKNEKEKLNKYAYESLKCVAEELRSLVIPTDVVINNKEKEIKKITDPTLADEQGTELDDKGVKIADEDKTVPPTKEELAKLIVEHFRFGR